MGIGTSIFLIAAGAIMTFAVETDSSNGFNINNAGVILMILGGDRSGRDDADLGPAPPPSRDG